MFISHCYHNKSQIQNGASFRSIILLSLMSLTHRTGREMGAIFYLHCGTVEEFVELRHIQCINGRLQ